MIDPDLEFVSEAEDLLEAARGDLAEWGDRIDSGAVDSALVGRLFRSMHSLKGVTATVGLHQASRLAHEAEELLDRLRTGRQQIDHFLLDSLSESIMLLDGLVHGRTDAVSRCQEMIDLLKAVLQGRRAPSQTLRPPSANLDPDLFQALTATECHRLQTCLEQEREVFLISCSLPMSSVQAMLPDVEHLLRSHGELLATIPGVPGEAGNIDFHLLFSGCLPDNPADQLPKEYRMRVRSVSSHGTSPAPAGDPSRQPAAASAPVVRIDSEKLDSLLEISKNLLLQQGQLKRLFQQCVREGASQASEVLERSFLDVERNLIRLQRSLNDARMVPVGFLFQRMTRVLRAAERQAGKQVRLEMRGKDVALDRQVLEQLHEPLLHLVRNAVDHGIEAPRERLAGGKPAQGLVILEARQQSGQIALEVRDDGRGIDLSKVRARAKALGMVKDADQLSEQQLFDLLFAPGFTTRHATTELSGRGVGMDVVRSQLEALGGLVTIESRPGAGSGITLILPVHKTIMPVLVVSVAGRPYALGLDAVRHVQPCSPAEIEPSESEALDREKACLPHLDLRTYLHAVPDGGRASPYLVVIGLGDNRASLLVDDLQGRREAVIRPFDTLLKQLAGFCGVAELVDAEAVLLLDPGHLIREVKGMNQLRLEPQPCIGGEDGSAEQPAAPCAPPGVSGRHAGFDSRSQDHQDPVPLPRCVGDRGHYLSFFAGGGEYALDIRNVVEIIEEGEWVRIPRAPAGLGGALLWRDQVVPIFERGPRTGEDGRSATCRGTVIVCNNDALRIAIAVERVGLMFNDSGADATEGQSIGSPDDGWLVSGLVCREGLDVGVLDLAALLDFSKEWNSVREKNPYCRR